MCKASTCTTCHGKTWWGCGNHIPSVMNKIDDKDKCVCEPKVERDGSAYPPMGQTAD